LKHKPESSRQIVKASRASSIGLEFAMTAMVGLGGGYWADKYFETSPWLTLGGFIFGVCAGFWSLFKAVQVMSEQLDKEDTE